ncbi:MAG: hypothetical protein F7C82_06385, partial [Desulfurococcales archaeon]|nr:hypothetical protein [Desulfurococcales archaeon]
MNEERLEGLAHEIHRRISARCQRLGIEKPNYVHVKNLLRRFIELNPHANVEDVDWAETWDTSLTYEELVEAFERAYPSYRWREEEYPQERYEEELVSYVLSQVEELSERSLRRLVEELRSRLGVQETEEHEEKATEAIALPIEKPKPRFVLDLVMLAKYPWLPEA